jgi:thiol-disulfide isomerase/thioredoxin
MTKMEKIKILIFKFYLIILSFLLISCYQENKNNNTQIDKKNNGSEAGNNVRDNGMITLVFDSVPKKIFISRKDNNKLGGRSYYNHAASYINSDGITQYLNPERIPHKDTINISIRDSKIEIYFTQMGLEGLSYLFYNGDIVLINYENGKPKINILNRVTKKYDYSYENMREYRNEGGLTIFEEYFRHITFPKSTKPLSKKERTHLFEKQMAINSIKLQDSLIMQMKLLDSLNNTQIISKDIYDYYKSKLIYIDLGRLAKLKKLNFTEESNDKSYLGDNRLDAVPFVINSEIDNLNKVSSSSILNPNDGFLQYKFFQDFLTNQYLPNYIENRTGKYTYEYENFGGSYYNWPEIFDSIQTSHVFSPKVKEFLLFRYMDKIAKDMTPDIVNKYYKKLISVNNNKNYVEIINSEYHIDNSTTNKLILKDSLERTFFLEDIIEENKGKFIYIDFLASWCGPCIEVIPSRIKLLDDYHKEDIVFITIAIDDSKDEWKRSEIFKSLKNLRHNYIVENPILSSFIKENHVGFVPRYFFFSKKGELLNPNAPGPNTIEIRQLFDKHLLHSN